MPRLKQRRTPPVEPAIEPLRSVHVPGISPSPPSSSKHLELTAVVKEAAIDALDALKKVDLEELADSNVSQVLLRCTNQAAAERLKGRFGIQPTKSKSESPIERAVPERLVTIALADYLPQTFNDILADVAEADIASLEIPANLIEQLEGFIGTFGDSGVLRIQLDHPQEQPDPGLEPIRLSMAAAHKALVNAGQGILEATSDEPVHQVRIEPSGNVMKPLRFSVDGKTVDLLPRNQRTLCVLALLLPNPPVTCDAFMELYSGNKIDSRRDFHTIVRVLKPLLPRLTWNASKGNRYISGLQIHSDVSTQALKEFLDTYKNS